MFVVGPRLEPKLQNDPQRRLSIHMAHKRDDQEVSAELEPSQPSARERSRFMNETELVLYCDFHGHSRKQNVFIYGCENKQVPDEKLKERIFPAMLSKNDPSKVRLHFFDERPNRTENTNLLEFSSRTRHANSKCKSTSRERDAWSCGPWASPTVTHWR